MGTMSSALAKHLTLRSWVRSQSIHHLAPIVIVGDDLQRHVTQYYNREYYLTLADVCERIGHPLESNSAMHRATGQIIFLKAMAEGITDVRPPKPVVSSTAPTANTTNGDGLGDLNEHPFLKKRS